MQYIKTQGLLVDTVKNEFNVLNDAISLSADTKQFSLFSGNGISLSADTKQFSLFSGNGISLSANTKQFSLFSGEGISLDVDKKNLSFLNGVFSLSGDSNASQFKVFDNGIVNKNCVGILNTGNTTLDKSVSITTNNSTVSSNSFSVNSKNSVSKNDSISLLGDSSTLANSSINILSQSTSSSNNSLVILGKNNTVEDFSVNIIGSGNKLDNKSLSMLSDSITADNKTFIVNSLNSTVSSNSIQINGDNNFVEKDSVSIKGNSNFITNSSVNIGSDNNKIYDNSLNIDGFNNLLSSNSVALNSSDSNIRTGSLAINTINSGLSTNSILINSRNTTSELSSINLLGNNNTLNNRSVLLNGSNNTISTNSLAFNTDNSSVTGNSVVLGGNSNIVNDFSFVVASSASNAYQESSVIGGKGNTASLSAVAIGSVNTQIIGQNSQSIGGSNNNFNSSNSVFLGGQSNAAADVPNGTSNGNNSFIIGGDNNKTGNNGIIIGGKNNSVQNSSIVIGGSGNNTGNFSNVVIINRNNVVVDRNDVVYLPEIRAQGNLTISGNITAGGNITSINTVTGNVSAFNINNFLYDIVPLTVDQNKTPSVGTLNTASFNYFGQPRLYVNNVGVSINTSSSVANQALTVSGNVSATGNLKVDNQLLIGSDTNLYRSATNTLKTDDTFVVGNVTVPTSLTNGTTNTVITHSSNSLEQRTINSRVWDTAATFLSGSGTTNQLLKLTGPNTIGNSSIADNGSTVSVTGNLNVDSNTLYVDSTNNRIGVLTTTPNETLTVSGNISATGNLTINGNVVLGSDALDTLTFNGGPVNFPNATSTGDAIVLGGDVNLYRSSADILRTSDTFLADGSIFTNGNFVIVTNSGYPQYCLRSDASSNNRWGMWINTPSTPTTGHPLLIGPQDTAGNGNGLLTLTRTSSSTNALGNVGINTSTPNERLTVNGGISATGNVSVNTGSRLNLATGSTGTSIFRDAGASGMAFTGSNLTRMFIADGGNVGIGTTVPSTKLTVSGSISASEDIYTQNFSTGGMLLGQNKRNAYFGRVGLTENKFHLNESNIGTTWTTRQSIRDWVDVAMSSDGRYQTAPLGQSNVAGNIYVSTDFGVNWSAKALAKVWTSVAVSSDGRYQTAVAWGDSVYVSSDFGSTWTSKAVVEYWSSVAMSSDGRYQYAITSNLSYISRDFGSTWTSGGALGLDIAMSSDGRIVAICDGQQSIAISYDFGYTFSIRYTSTDGYPFKITMSSDGRYITASSYSATNGYVYTSTNFGSTFSVITLITDYVNGYGVAMSSDGRVQTSCWVGNTIRQSTDWGETWVSKGGTGSWWGIAMSSDGGRQTVVESGGYIYTSNCDIVNYENLSVVGSVSANGTVIGSGTIQIGTQANKATLTYTTNTARTYTIPDAGANTSFVMASGNQTIAGIKTFSSNIAGSITGNAATATILQTSRTIWGQSFNGSANIAGNIDVTNVVMGTQANKATLTYTTNTARAYTIPDAGANADFVMNAGNQTIAGTKTFSGNTTFPNGSAATPSINFTGSTNTGFYFATNQVSTTIAGSERFRVTNAWTYTPKLLVNTKTTSTEVFKVEGDSRLKDTYINSNGQEILISTNYGGGTAAGRNIYIGNGGEFTSGTSGSFGSYNVSLGYTALSAVTTGYQNISIGSYSLQSCRTGYNNVCLGESSGKDLVSGNDNVYIGYFSGSRYSSVSNLICIGNNAGKNISNSTSMAIGVGALQSGATANTGANNIAIGQNALNVAEGTATGNVALGNVNLASTTTGSYNVALGAQVLQNNTTGIGNIGIGYQANVANTTGQYNIAIGHQALDTNTLGNYNVAIGRDALSIFNNSFGANGFNVAIGYNALGSTTPTSNTNGIGNVAIGYGAGDANTIGSYNTFIGYDAIGTVALTGTNNTCIGYQATPSNVWAANEITLGNSNISVLRCKVNTITLITSDERYKTNITPISAGINFIDKLKPVTFNYIEDGMEEIGFIAQDVIKVQEEIGIRIPRLVVDSNPDRLTLAPNQLFPVVIKALQDLSERLEKLESKIK